MPRQRVAVFHAVRVLAFLVGIVVTGHYLLPTFRTRPAQALYAPADQGESPSHAGVGNGGLDTLGANAPQEHKFEPAETQVETQQFTLSTTTSTSSTTSTSTTGEPTKTEFSKIVVMGRLSTEDTDWVGENLKDWQNAIYHVDLAPNATSPSGLRTKMNKAKEAMPYLTYIIDHYPDFPDIMAFIHAHRNGMPQAWHNDAPDKDAVTMLRGLKLESVAERGYVNLRCIQEIGCPDEVQPFRDPPDPEKHAEHAYPYFYAAFFGVSFAEMKDQIAVVATPCCAQFAVSKAQVLKRSKEDYVKYRTFLENTHYDDDTAGRVLEYMWHIIFGRDAVHCEDVLKCWCSVFGRCDMTRSGRKKHGWRGGWA